MFVGDHVLVEFISIVSEIVDLVIQKQVVLLLSVCGGTGFYRGRLLRFVDVLIAYLMVEQKGEDFTSICRNPALLLFF